MWAVGGGPWRVCGSQCRCCNPNPAYHVQQSCQEGSRLNVAAVAARWDLSARWCSRWFVSACLVTAAVACTGQPRVPIPGHVCPSTRFSPGLVPGSVKAGPVFFVSGPEDCQAHAYTYAGERTDRRLIFPSCIEACQGPVIAPDGSVPSPSDRPSALGSRIWATDSRNVCGFPDGGPGSTDEISNGYSRDLRSLRARYGLRRRRRRVMWLRYADVGAWAALSCSASAR
jgi:hypothetical protein